MTRPTKPKNGGSVVPPEIHIFLHQGETAQLTAISDKLDKLLKGQTKMAGEIDDLEAQITANDAVDQSAITLLEGLKAMLDAAGTDPAKLKALSDQLGASSERLAAAVVANTPAEKEP